MEDVYAYSESFESWMLATLILCIISLAASIAAFCVSWACILQDRGIVTRPSFRLTLWIALFTIISSSARIGLSQKAFMAQRSELQLRAVWWLILGSDLCASLLSMFVSLHVVLIMAIAKYQTARRFHLCYEYIAMVIALIVTHPIFYICKEVRWDSDLQDVLFDGRLIWQLPIVWPIFAAWIALAISICIMTLLYLCYKMVDSNRFFSVANRIAVPNSPISPGSATWDEQTVSLHQIQESNNVRPLLLRFVCFAVFPIVTEIWSIICVLAPRSNVWLYGLAMAMSSTQGILCPILLASNPACDELWLTLFSCLFKHRKSEKTNNEELRLDFARLDTSTINLSPYQSRSNSIS